MNKIYHHIFRLLSKMKLGFWSLLIISIAGNAIAESQEISISAQRILSRANQLLDKQETDKAIDILRSYKCNETDQYIIQFTLGNCYMMADQYKEANAAYLKSVKANERYGPAWYNLANSYIELDQLDRAGEAFDTAYDRYEPKRPDILYYAASVYLGADLPKKALEDFNRLLMLHPQDVKLEWQEIYARILLASNMPEAALPVIEQLADKMQGSQKKEWQEFLLYQYLSLNMEKKAIAHARELTHNEPLEPRWWKALTQIALAQDQYKEALVALTVYGQLNPLTIDEKKLRADLNLMLDIPGQSVAILEDILIDTYEPGLVEKIVYGYTEKHTPEDALKWIEKGLDADANNIKLLMLKGEVLFQIKAYADAEKIFRTVVNQDKTHGKAWLMLGYAAWYGENIPTAVSAMKEAAQFAQHQKVANEALTGLLRIQKEKS